MMIPYTVRSPAFTTMLLEIVSFSCTMTSPSNVTLFSSVSTSTMRGLFFSRFFWRLSSENRSSVFSYRLRLRPLPIRSITSSTIVAIRLPISSCFRSLEPSLRPDWASAAVVAMISIPESTNWKESVFIGGTSKVGRHSETTAIFREKLQIGSTNTPRNRGGFFC